MHVVRRNTREFRAVARLLEDYRDSPARRRLIRLFALRPADPPSDRVLINKLRQHAAAIYNLTYESILQYLGDRRHKLYRDDDAPLYYFKTAAGSSTIEFPFEFAGRLKKQVSSESAG